MSPATAVTIHALWVAALFWLAGKAAVDHVPDLARRSAWSRAGWSWLLGTAVVGILLYALSHWAGMPLRRGWILATLLPCAALGAVGGLRRGRPSVPAGPTTGRSRWLRRAAATVGLTVCLALVAEAATTPFPGWDARMTWAAHARYVHAAGTVDAPVLQEDAWLVAHPTYPLLLPLLQVAAMELSPLDDERVAHVLYVLFFPALLLVLHDVAGRLSGPAAGSALVVVAAALPVATFEASTGAISGYSDLPLAAYWGGGLLLLAAAAPQVATGAAAGVLGAATLLSKREGTVLAVLLVGAAALRWWQAARTRRGGGADAARGTALTCTALVAVAAGLYASWRRGIAARFQEDYLDVLRQGELDEALGRIPAILAEVSRATTSWDWWYGFWIAAALLLVAGWRGLARPEALVLLPPLAGAVAAYLAAYVLSPWREAVVAQVEVSWGRLLLHLLVPTMALLAMAWGGLGRAAAEP